MNFVIVSADHVNIILRPFFGISILLEFINCFVTEYSAILPKRSDNHIPIENANSCIFVPLPNIIDLFYVPITEISKF